MDLKIYTLAKKNPDCDSTQLTKPVEFSRVADPDLDQYPDWIRIQSGQWIRIRSPDPDPGG
jgi:hypothetical protein